MRGGFENNMRGGMRNQRVESATNKKDTLLRLLKFVLRNYKFSFAAVAVCIQ